MQWVQVLGGARDAQPEWTWQRCVDCPAVSPKTRIDTATAVEPSPSPVTLTETTPTRLDPLQSPRTWVRFFADATTINPADRESLHAWVLSSGLNPNVRVNLTAYADHTRASHERSDERAREVQVALYKAGIPMPQFRRQIMVVADPSPVVQITVVADSDTHRSSPEPEALGTRPTAAELADRATSTALPGEIP